MDDLSKSNANQASRGRRDALDTEQTIADAEHTAADVDQTAADIDQTGSDRDQETSNRDQHLSEADQRASDRDQLAADRDRDSPSREQRELEHRATRTQREETSAERARNATVRTDNAQRRFQVAEQRDEAARSRDLASEARDVAAVARDGLAALYDDEPSTVNRKRAAEDREHAAGDREHAAGDRWETRLDRDEMREVLAEAHIDDVTGTYRRSMGNIALRGEIDRAHRSHSPLVFAFLEVDKRMGAAPHLGQAPSDELLVEIVGNIRSHLRSYDSMVRFGDDAFVCGLPDTDTPGARKRFDAIQLALGSMQKTASISVGFTELERGDTLESMIVRGEAALFSAQHP